MAKKSTKKSAKKTETKTTKAKEVRNDFVQLLDIGEVTQGQYRLHVILASRNGGAPEVAAFRTGTRGNGSEFRTSGIGCLNAESAEGLSHLLVQAAAKLREVPA